MRTILFVVPIARVRNGKTAVRSRHDLDVVRCSFVRNSRHKCASRSQIGDELFGRIVITGIDRVVQLPEVFQPRRFLERLESGDRSAFFSRRYPLLQRAGASHEPALAGWKCPGRDGTPHTSRSCQLDYLDTPGHVPCSTSNRRNRSCEIFRAR